MIPINKLRALYWAEIHMREARDTSAHLLKIQNPGEELRHCIYTGIVVSYARSFGANQGLSALGAEFRSFPDPQMQKLHDALLNARNTMFAHRVMTKEAAKLSPEIPKTELPRIKVDVSPTGQSHWIVNRPVLPTEYLTQVIALCDFQISRMNQTSSAMLAKVCAGKSFAPGTYELGVDFP